MSYCRFENTYLDLLDCQEALTGAGSIRTLEQNANEYEKKYIRRLVALCKEIADDFGEEEEHDEDDGSTEPF